MSTGTYTAVSFSDYISRYDKARRLVVRAPIELDGTRPISFRGPTSSLPWADIDWFHPRRIRIPELSVTLFEDVIIAGPGFLFTSDGYAMFGGSFHHDGSAAFKAPWREIDMNEVSPSTFTCSSLSQLDTIDAAYTIAYHAPGNYHHIICDILPRLLFYNQDDVRAFFQSTSGSADMPILINSDYLHIRTLLSSVGQANLLTALPSIGAMRVKKLYVPSVMNDFMSWASPAIFEYYRSLMHKCNIPVTCYSNKNKIFTLRRDFKYDRRRIHNASQLADILLSFGFEEIFPEGMSWIDEMRVFGGASHIVGAMGSNLSNVVFSQPGTRILSVQSNASGYNLTSFLAAAGQMQNGYVWGESFDYADRGEHCEFYVDPELFRASLQNLLEST